MLWSSLTLVLVIIIINVAALQGSLKWLDLYLRSLTEASIVSVAMLTLLAGLSAQRYLRLGLFSISSVFLALLVATIDVRLISIDSPSSSAVDTTKTELRIASFSKMGRNRNAQNLDSFLQEMSNKKVQIVALQEITEQELSTIDRRAMHVHMNSPLATAIYSTWPMEEISVKRKWFQVVRTNGYVVVNVHMPKFSRGVSRYEEKYDALLEFLTQLEDEKVILLGDLNITKYDQYYQSLLRLGFIDTYNKSGHGSGYTFPAEGRRIGFLGAFLRIDYILVRNIKPVFHSRLDHSYGSDHYPIITGLVSE